MSNRKEDSNMSVLENLRRAILGPSAEEVYAPLHEAVEKLNHDMDLQIADMHHLLSSIGAITEEDRQQYVVWKNGLDITIQQEIDSLYPDSVASIPDIEIP
jgi:hypothetical protein